MAVVDYYLKIDGIEGESSDSKHKGEIEVESWSLSAAQSGSFSSGGGGGAGKVAFQDVHFTSKVNKGSPKLMLACANGEHIKKATLVCRKAGKEQHEYLAIHLSDVLVSSYHLGGGGDEKKLLPSEQFSLNFAKVEYEYKPQQADGSLGAAVKKGWDVTQNKAV